MYKVKVLENYNNKDHVFNTNQSLSVWVGILKNKIILTVIVIAFFAGVSSMFILPNEASLQFQQLFLSTQVNVPTLEAFATTNLANVQALPANNIVLAQSYYFIAFTGLNQDNHIKTIEIQFPSGFVLSNATILEQTVPAIATFSISGQKLTFTFPTEQSAGSFPFSFLIGGIGNGKSLKNQISVTTKDQLGNISQGPTLSPVFTLTPITNSMIIPNAVTTAIIANNAVTNAKIANGAVTQSKISSNSVNATQIVNGAMTSAKISPSFMKFVTLTPNQNGWVPDNNQNNFVILDSFVRNNSTITITITGENADQYACSVYNIIQGDSFRFHCTGFVSSGTSLNYMIINP